VGTAAAAAAAAHAAAAPGNASNTKVPAPGLTQQVLLLQMQQQHAVWVVDD
jgi:hypothetical protein